jgi:hypothetical protein
MIASRKALAPLALALLGIAANGLLALANRGSWNVDFSISYAAGKLAGSGHLYDPAKILPLELTWSGKAFPFGRIPAYAFALKPLAALPFPLARALWLGLSLAAVAGFVALWPLGSRPWAMTALCWSAPLAMCLAFGQDSVLFLFFVTVGVRLLLQGRRFSAGLAFSLCVIKPHLALLLPVVLLARREWRALAGGLAGGLALAAASFAVEGPGWPAALRALTRRPDFDPAADRMPNLRGLLSLAGGGLGLEIALGLAVVAAIWFLSRRLPLPEVFALALAGGLLLGHHAYVYDALLLLPALLLAFQKTRPEWMRLWALVLLTPLPYLLFLTVWEWPAHLAVTGYTVALVAAMTIAEIGQRRPRRPPPRPAELR